MLLPIARLLSGILESGAMRLRRACRRADLAQYAGHVSELPISRESRDGIRAGGTLRELIRTLGKVDIQTLSTAWEMPDRS
jgi:hypothetical protein